jgi:hypothetical protein
VTQLTARPPATATRAISTWGEDLACALGAVWVVGGLYLDGWAHTHTPELETFFTPWHAVLYSGFAALAACHGAVVGRRRSAAPAAAPRTWVPAGYLSGLVGVAVFLVAGLADMIWHTLLGIEVDLEALLSPPHLALLTGGVLMITTPLRAAAARGAATRGLDGGRLAMLPAIVSLAVAAAAAAFFLSYVSPFDGPPPMSVWAPDSQVLGLAYLLVTTVVLLVPVFAAYTRLGRVPPGLIAAVTAAVAVPVGVFTDFEWLPVQLAATAGGMLADVAVALVATQTPRLVPVAAGVLVPALVWSAYLVGAAATVGIVWPVPLWAGVVVLTALGGAVLGSLFRAAAPA